MTDPAQIVTERHGIYRIQCSPGVAVEQVLEALHLAGNVLKASRKSVTRRVGGWVVKESRITLAEIAKHALRPDRYRAGWRAALYLQSRCIPVPAPQAYVERRWGGVVGNAFVCEYLDGWVNVEEHARSLVAERASCTAVDAFLRRLAEAVNGFNDTGAFHTDLSGKNIFTREGSHFCFIDLDGVLLEHPYGVAERQLNHVQLYDSFCDLWDDSLLGPFLLRMLPVGADGGVWLKEVKEGQSLRRSRTETIWRKRRRTPATPVV